jgi:hypothetical protein
VDGDLVTIELARGEAHAQGLQNVEFAVADIREWGAREQFDAV